MQGKNRIAALRKAAGWTQPQLAEILGVNVTTVWRWEHSKVRISDEVKARLAELFACSVAYLMGDGENGGNGQQERGAA